MTMGLLDRGYEDPNTESPQQLSAARNALEQLVKTTNLKFDTNEYQHLADGSLWLHQAWSGDMASAPYYLPKGTPAKVLRYWWPANGRGPINNDMFGVLRGARNPVLAHLFLNHVLDPDEAFKNFSFVGYQQPLNEMTPEAVIAHGLVPPNLRSTLIRDQQFRNGLVQGPLSQYGAVLWENAWAAVRSS
jgi:spermidine/putrescine transport system substrate-binding protein